MQFFDNRILLVKSSEVIDMYSIEDELEGQKNYMFTRMDSAISARLQISRVKWIKYHTLYHKGFV